MDSTSPQLPDQALAPEPGRDLRVRLHSWLPLVLVVFVVIWGLLINGLRISGEPRPGPVAELLPEGNDPATLATDYALLSLDELLQDRAWESANWVATPAGHSGIGYRDQPTTFRFTLSNPGETSLKRLIVVPAPFLDHIAPAVVEEDGSVTRLAVMGDTYPYQQRHYDLPHWIWPITLPPHQTLVLLFEVSNSGPTLLPVTLQDPERVPGRSAYTLVWKSFIAGLLTFALLFNIIIVVMLKRPGLAWIGVLLLGVIHSQLVMEGFGQWLLWPQWPVLNSLLGVSLPLSLIALCQFTPHFMELPRLPTRILHTFSALAFILLLLTPFNLSFPGQGTLLVLAVVAGLFILGVVMARLRTHVHARYYALAMLAIFIGALAASLRTIGWVPVNGLTDSAFFVGTAVGSVILTIGIGRLLLEERRRRQGAAIRARHEQQLRSRIEKDYDRLLTTHRVSGMPNRAILEETLQGLHNRGDAYSLALIRLDRFNEIEQTLGYRAAEDLLQIYLRRLNSYLKQHFGDQLVLFREHALSSLDTITHGFAVRRQINDSLPNPECLDSFINRRWRHLERWLSANFTEGRYTFNWGPSMGIAAAPDHGRIAADVISSAGFACLKAGKSVTIYDPAVAREQYRQQVLMLDLESALANDEISVLYQRKVSIREARVVSCEALLRWHHPEYGLVPPGSWIPLAEQMGAIHSVTRWVVHRVCRDWPALCASYGASVAVAVNISALDLKQPFFDRELEAILAQYRIPPRQMILEITETAMMSDTVQGREMILKLSQAGFRIALDDFGTGHSSLSVLASFALDELKIDRSFLDDIIRQPVRQRVFRAALELGEALDLDVVVEGVDDEAVATWLQQFPGLFGQGYYWGQPENLHALSNA